MKRGLQLKKAGNEIVSSAGRTGNSSGQRSRRRLLPSALPSAELTPLAERLKLGARRRAGDRSLGGQFPFPGFRAGLRIRGAAAIPNEYPFNEGRLVSNKGLDIAVREYEEHFTEEHVPHSNALHSVLKGRGAYFVGPMARYNLNFDQLAPLAQASGARRLGWARRAATRFKSIIVRAVEIALRLRGGAADHRSL